MILILGGGLAGLSASIQLAQRAPERPRLVLEKGAVPGGLCRSRCCEGFTFDYTGHYLHLRDSRIIAWADELLGEELMTVDRRARIHLRGRRLHFPFQANLHGLPEEVMTRCVTDFFASGRAEMYDDGPPSFARWARRTFGDGIAEEFMLPYNEKLLGVDLERLSAEWVSWSVPRPSPEEVVRGALGLVNEGMGYNPRFLYPRSGGIGRLAQAVSAQVGDDLRLGAEVVGVDARARRVRLASGECLAFDSLVSTLPLPALLRQVEGLDEGAEPLADLAGRLRSTAVIELALGIDRKGVGDGAHWIYFPEKEIPFYRVGLPSAVCPSMAPQGRSSLSVEFSISSDAPTPELSGLLAQAREGLERVGLLVPADRIVVHDLARIDPAYVIYDFARTPVVEEALARLEGAGIYSIGRFGAWTYSYMERALLDGIEVAEKILGRRDRDCT